jgi:hypothetical protein
MQHNTNAVEPMWCVAANVVLERTYGPGGLERRSGYKHFAPGAKVYVYDIFGGMWERVTVIGRHRKSFRFICLSMAIKHLTNWRAELVYSPYVIRQIRTKFLERGELWMDGSEGRAEEIAADFAAHGKRQPFVTRQPTVQF